MEDIHLLYNELNKFVKHKNVPNYLYLREINIFVKKKIGTHKLMKTLQDRFVISIPDEQIVKESYEGVEFFIANNKEYGIYKKDEQWLLCFQEYVGR